MKMRNILVMLLLASFLSVPATAKYIQIVPNLSAPEIITEDALDIPITVINNGDESAYNLQFALLTPEGFSSQSMFFRELSPKEQRNGTFKVKINEGTMGGTYAIGLLTHYTDANQYPFSSVNSILVNYRNPTVSRVYGVVPPIEIREGPQVAKLNIRNRDVKSHQVRIKLLLPDELKTDQMQMEYDLAPNEEKQISATISSAGALGGSTYPIFAVMSYTEDNQYYSSMAVGVIQIKEIVPKNPVSFLPWLLAAAVVIVVAVIVYKMMLPGGKKKKKK